MPVPAGDRNRRTALGFHPVARNLILNIITNFQCLTRITQQSFPPVNDARKNIGERGCHQGRRLKCLALEAMGLKSSLGGTAR